jgi:FAD/FMN-containing dehydrogenase
LSVPAPELSGRLRELLGAQAFLTDAADTAPFLTDHRALYHGRALGVALPRDTAQVSRLLAFCNGARIGVVPHGGNTGYCGGATPDASGRELVLSLKRMNRIRAIDAANYSLVAEAGCVLDEVRQAALQAERFLPLQLGSGGSCQIGGNLSTNAGGTNVVRYGMARDLVLGLEVVLADGQILDTLSTLRKDNTGYDIRSLFVGAEGTLGVITAASLKLFPLVRASATAFAAVPDVQAAVTLLSQLRAASGDCVTSFELLPRVAVELAVRHIEDVRDPLPERSYRWYVLCELSSSRADLPLSGWLTDALAGALQDGTVLTAVVAASERERDALWTLRENIPAAQRRAGAGLKHDIALPVAALPEFVRRASALLAAEVPEGYLVAYGHVGDGNLHFNLTQAQGVDAAAFLARGEAVRRRVHDLAREFGGSFSAEHGIGRLKVAELERYASPVELELMRRVKQAFDPHGIMNPGKVLRTGAADG